MRRKFLAHLFLVLLGCLDLSIPLYSQVSFSQPPLFSGTGNLFVTDFNGDGKLDILCSDGTLNLGNGDGTFTKGVSVSGVPLVVADFNGDGKPDILEQTTGTLVVLLGNGDGTFQSPINTASGATLLAVAAGNLTSNTKADVVGVFNNSLIVYISNGDGTFAQGVSYALGTNPTAAVLSLGDFNGDRRTDIVVTAFYGTSSAVDEITFLGNGDGTLQIAKTTSGLPNQSVTGVAIGDFNGDGRLDLAIGTPSATSCLSNCQGAVSLMLGNGDGTFQPPQSAFSTAASGGVLAAADLNGDGKVDLVLETASVAQIYLGNGDGTFSNKSNYVLFPQSGVNFPSSKMAIGDFNADKKDDLAAGNAVLLGNADGTFQGVSLALITQQPSFAVVGQFNKAGASGVAAVAANASPGAQTYSLYILSNNGSGVLSLAHTYTLQNSGRLATADLNGDGNLDLVVVGTDPTTQDWSYSVLLGNGDGSFQSPVYYPQSVGGGTSVVVADFNNDHKPDLAVAAGSQTVAILLGNGDGTFAAPVYYYDAGGSPLLVADFNGDGKLDIAAGEETNTLTGILLGNGDGTFQAAIFPASLNGFWAQFTADFNNDGIPDLMSSNQVALGSSDATFAVLPQIPQPGMGIVAGAIGDLNGDGKLDIFVNETTGDQSQQGGVQLGNGDGTFESIIEVPTSTNFPPFPVLLADMNGDGLPDLVFLWQSSFTGEGPSGVGVMLNTTQVVSEPDFQLVG